MALKTIYDKQDDIPEQFRELYTERNGKFELTGIEGVKTQADVDRVSEALRKEKSDHVATRDKLKAFGDLDPEKAVKDLDELDELRIRVEGAETGKLDEEKIERLVTQRVARERAPIERENKRLKEENETLTASSTELQGRITASKVETEIRKHAETAKVVPSAIDDLVVIGRGVFELSDDGAVVTRDGVGVTPGVGVDVYLTDMKDKRPHWWPASTGGGASGDGRGGVPGAKNPWSRADWNLTDQGRVVREHGIGKAQQMAKSAGSSVGATAPVPEKKTA